jgi:DNA-binding response OmpR family regulator
VYRPLGEAAPGRPLHLNGRRLNVLHVEDDSHLATMYRHGMEMAGFAVTWAPDAGRALAAIEAQRFDLLLLDVQLPGTSGLDLLLMLRQMPATELPAVILTNLDDAETQDLARRRGASLFLLKVSTSPRQLVESLLGLVESKV